MENFEVDIDNNKYLIKFENEMTKYKSLKLSITRYEQDTILLLEMKKYYKIRRRIYNNLININKLKNGKIRRYQVFNKLELEIIIKYLITKNILFRICEQNISYERLYHMLDKSYKFCFSMNEYYPENNKVLKNTKLYIKVYKGFINLTEFRDNKISCNHYTHKYCIYL